MITFGQVTSALVDALFANVSDGWRYDFGLAAVPGVILLVGFIFCPESPRYLFIMNQIFLVLHTLSFFRYLVQKGRIDHARAVLKKLRSASCNIEEELQEIIKVIKRMKEQTLMTLLTRFVKRMRKLLQKEATAGAGCQEPQVSEKL